jgi:hypothetical protein
MARRPAASGPSGSPPDWSATKRKLLAAQVMQAGGLTIAFTGGVTIIKGLHVLEHGSFYFDSLVHTQFAGDPARLSVIDGGVDLRCDGAWVISGFQLGSATRLDADAQGPKWPAADPTSSTLTARTQAVVAAVTQQTRAGDVLLLGSTDPKGWSTGSQGNNLGLAIARANEVAGLLRTPLAGRNVLIANEKMTGGPAPAAPGPVVDGLARAVFGVKESSDRSVRVCVLEPRPHTIQMTTTAGNGTSAGFLGGAITLFAAVIVGLFVLFSFFALRRRGETAQPATSRRSPGTTDP